MKQYRRVGWQKAVEEKGMYADKLVKKHSRVAWQAGEALQKSRLTSWCRNTAESVDKLVKEWSRVGRQKLATEKQS